MPITLKLNRTPRYSTIPVAISPGTRVASIGRNKIQTGYTRRFSTESWVQIEAFEPQALIGGTADLKRLANLAESGIVDLSSVDTAILVTAGFGDNVINDVERVVLWQAFGVPVYELLLSSDGRLLGSECEAHAGWHLEPNVRLSRTGGNVTVDCGREKRQLGMTALVETAACECGRSEPRIVMDGRPRLVRVLAATA